jgi:hypothetical protein
MGSVLAKLSGCLGLCRSLLVRIGPGLIDIFSCPGSELDLWERQHYALRSLFLIFGAKKKTGGRGSHRARIRVTYRARIRVTYRMQITIRQSPKRSMLLEYSDKGRESIRWRQAESYSCPVEPV